MHLVMAIMLNEPEKWFSVQSEPYYFYCLEFYYRYFFHRYYCYWDIRGRNHLLKYLLDIAVYFLGIF